MPTRSSASQGSQTRAAILRTAADIASVDGLDGLTVGRLAGELAMSKSGLFAHFGSKQAMQLATIEAARQRYVQEVITPALAAEQGVRRLQALCDSFLSYLERAVFPGGCFFAAAMAEFDAKPPGAVRDSIADCQTLWAGSLAGCARDALSLGELTADCDPDQLTFELEAVLLSANWYFRLYNDHSYLDRARQAIRTRLTRDGTPSRGTFLHQDDARDDSAYRAGS